MNAKTRQFSPARLREARGEKFSPEDIASACGVSKQTVHNWERGKGEPDATPLAAIASLTGRSMDFFFVSARAAS